MHKPAHSQIISSVEISFPPGDMPWRVSCRHPHACLREGDEDTPLDGDEITFPIQQGSKELAGAYQLRNLQDISVSSGGNGRERRTVTEGEIGEGTHGAPLSNLKQ